MKPSHKYNLRKRCANARGEPAASNQVCAANGATRSFAIGNRSHNHNSSKQLESIPSEPCIRRNEFRDRSIKSEPIVKTVREKVETSDDLLSRSRRHSRSQSDNDLSDTLEQMKRNGVKPEFVCIVCNANYKYLKCWNKHMAQHFAWFSRFGRSWWQSESGHSLIGSQCMLCALESWTSLKREE